VLIQANALHLPIADESVQCVVTSPPYWGLRDYGIPGQLGIEPTLGAYVTSMVAVFREVWRVLKRDGVLWLNLGDSYAAAPTGSFNGGGFRDSSARNKTRDLSGVEQSGVLDKACGSGLKLKDLCGIPWRVAFALQAEGWYLRSDIIWCLSGGAWVYARTQKGDMPMMVRDMARLNPATVQLWNGEKWTQLRGMNKSKRRGDELEIVLRSGERISCTPTHRFPTQRGLLGAGEIRVGDAITSCRIPEPENPRDCALDEDAAWFAGLYIAEGSRSMDTIQIAGHAKETARWDRLQRIAAKFGGSITRTVSGNKQDIRLYGRVLNAIIDELVTGRVAKNKGFAPTVWRYSDAFVAAMVDGYLAGDGHNDAKNGRWRIGFCRNYNLERDLRTACARLGYTLTLNLSSVEYEGRQVPAFRGEIRKERSGHHNERDKNEVVEIRKARCREVYDIGVADEPHLFALASGILTHNSKPNPMPESVTDRPTKAHEYLFMLAKSSRYYYDAKAIRDNKDAAPDTRFRASTFAKQGAVGRHHEGAPILSIIGRNRRSVWTIPTEPYAGAHFATFPRALVEPCVLAGSRPGDVVLDPFTGSGTVGVVCRTTQRRFVGCDLSMEYLRQAQIRVEMREAVARVSGLPLFQEAL